MANLEKFLEVVRKEATLFKNLKTEQSILFHHNDTDGLSSGTILFSALRRENIKVRSYCFEKPYLQALSCIFNDPDIKKDSIIFFADFGSGILPEISALNNGRFNIFVLDHHSVSKVSDPKIHVVNCLEHGVTSRPDCSASAICAEFAISLHTRNKDLAALGVLGALGDGFVDESGHLTGVNKHLYDEAEQQGLMTFKGGYFFNYSPLISATDLTGYIDALGSFGYFRGGPDLAIKGLTDGFGVGFIEKAKEFRSEYDQCLERFIKNLSLHQATYFQSFQMQDSFPGMGVKTVGLVCDHLKGLPLIDVQKYVAGFQLVPNTIPGLGPVRIDEFKVSMRIPRPLYERVLNKQMPDLTQFLPQAAKALGGLVDACHPHAGAVTVPIGKEEKLIQLIDDEVVKHIGN